MLRLTVAIGQLRAKIQDLQLTVADKLLSVPRTRPSVCESAASAGAQLRYIK